jgi:histidyl-tRNA synthetase
MDIDAAGAASVAVDAEIIAIMCKIMTAMKIRTFTVLINNRKLIDALLESCGISDPARQKHVLRVVDKLAKVGVENIRKELGTGRIDESGDPIPGVGLEPEAIEKVLHFIAIEAPTREEVVDRLAKALPSLRWQEFRRLFKEHGISFGARQTEEDVLKILDAGNKRDIISIREELGNGRIDESGNLVPGLNLAPEIIDKIIILESLDTIASAFETGNVQTRKAEEALDEMRELAAALDALGVGEANAKFDPSLARGLDYYTGPVFEMILPQAPEFGSVMGGGRYDGLVSRFADRPIPATGMSVGLDRLMAALTYLRPREKHITSRSQVLVVSVGNVPKAETLRLATELRKARIRTETYFASRKKMQMGQQLSHADHYGIPVAVIIGEDELARGVVSVKDLRAGKEQRQDIQDREAYRQAGKTGQKTVARAEMAVHIRALLNPKATVRSREHNP